MAAVCILLCHGDARSKSGGANSKLWRWYVQAALCPKNEVALSLIKISYNGVTSHVFDTDKTKFTLKNK